MFLRYLYHGITLNITTCFGPEGGQHQGFNQISPFCIQLIYALL